MKITIMIITINLKYEDNEGTEQEMNAKCLTFEGAVQEVYRMERNFLKGQAEVEQRAKDALEEKSEE